MPQGRIILKRICQSKKLADLKTDGARLLYTWLIPNVDINGCFSGDPEVIKGQVFTRLKKSVNTITGYMDDLSSVGLILQYKANGDQFLHIPDFAEKQPSLNPSKEAESTIPPPNPDLLQGNSGPTLRKVKESKVKSKQSKPMADFELFWKAYPKKKSKDAARRRWETIKPDADLLQTMLAAIEQQKTSDQWKKDGGQFIPNPATWLNGGCWTDEVIIAPRELTSAEQLEVYENAKGGSPEFCREQYEAEMARLAANG